MEEVKSEKGTVKSTHTQSPALAPKTPSEISPGGRKGETATRVYDEEAKEFVDISHEQQRVAGYVHQQVLLGAFITSMAIKKMFDERLYLALGCSSRQEYVDTFTPYGMSQVMKFYKIGKKFDGLLPLNNNELSLPSSSDGSEKFHSSGIAELGDLGINKLYELCKVEDEDFRKLIKKGKIELNGEMVSLEEIKEMTVREVQDKLSEYKRKYQRQIDRLSEKEKTLKAENDAYKQTIDKLTAKMKTLEEMETVFGGPAGKLNEKKELLKRANEALNLFENIVFKIGITIEDPAPTQRDLLALVSKLDGVNERVQVQYGEVTSQF